jgi:cyanate permease
MSDGSAGKKASTDKPGGSLGAIAIWRQTTPAAKALLVGVFVNRLGAFLQIFMVLFLTHKGFSASQAGLALGVYGAGTVIGSFAGGWLSDLAQPAGRDPDQHGRIRGADGDDPLPRDLSADPARGPAW